MKTLVLSVLSGLLSVASLTSPASAQWGRESQSGLDKPLIKVSGKAVIYVRPDKYLITLGIEKKNIDAAAAQMEVAASAKSLVIALKEFGIGLNDIQMDMIDVRRFYSINTLEQTEARQAFSVTTREPDKIETLLVTALRSGATSVLNVGFQTTELRKYRDQARQNAIKAAKEKAALMASEFGVKLLVPYSISEVMTWEDTWYGRWWGRSGLNSINDERDSTETADIPMGQIAVQSEVSASYTHSGQAF